MSCRGRWMYKCRESQLIVMRVRQNGQREQEGGWEKVHPLNLGRLPMYIGSLPNFRGCTFSHPPSCSSPILSPLSLPLSLFLPLPLSLSLSFSLPSSSSTSLFLSPSFPLPLPPLPLIMTHDEGGSQMQTGVI